MGRPYMLGEMDSGFRRNDKRGKASLTFRYRLFEDIFGDLPQMVTRYRQRHSQREDFRTPEKTEGEESPIIGSSFFDDPELPNGTEESLNMMKLKSRQAAADPGIVVPEEQFCAFVILLRRINGLKQVPVSLDQSFPRHPGFEIEGRIRVVPAEVLQHPVFLLETLEQTGASRGVKQPDHGSGDAGFLNKGNLRFEN